MVTALQRCDKNNNKRLNQQLNHQNHHNQSQLTSQRIFKNTQTPIGAPPPKHGKCKGKAQEGQGKSTPFQKRQREICTKTTWRCHLLLGVRNWRRSRWTMAITTSFKDKRQGQLIYWQLHRPARLLHSECFHSAPPFRRMNLPTSPCCTMLSLCTDCTCLLHARINKTGSRFAIWILSSTRTHAHVCFLV